MYIDHNSHIMLWLTIMEGLQSLTFRWHWFSSWGRERFTFSFACQGSQYSIYDYLQPVPPPDYPRYTTNNRWHCVDAYIHDGTGTVLQSVLPKKKGKNSFMKVCNLSAVWLPRTHHPKSLRLHWRWFSSWGRDGVAICFPKKGGPEFLYDWLQPIGSVITQYTRRKIIDALLRLIFKMRQGACHDNFCPEKRPIPRICITTTEAIFNYQTYMI